MDTKSCVIDTENTITSPIEELDSARVLLQFLRNQQHDFMNHIQVIMAYLQLNKSQRAMEYIEDIIGKKRELSTIYKLMDPEIAACLIAGITKADFHQVNLQFDVKSQRAIQADSRLVAGLCTELLHVFIETAATLPDKNMLIKVNDNMNGQSIGFKLNGSVDAAQLLEEIEALNIAASQLGCSLSYQHDEVACSVTCEIAGDTIKDTRDA